MKYLNILVVLLSIPCICRIRKRQNGAHSKENFYKFSQQKFHIQESTLITLSLKRLYFIFSSKIKYF